MLQFKKKKIPAQEVETPIRFVAKYVKGSW